VYGEGLVKAAPIHLATRSKGKSMGLFHGATSINTLAWSTPFSDRGSPQFRVSSWGGVIPSGGGETAEAYAHWERNAEWER
jgi:hypothetical protein